MHRLLLQGRWLRAVAGVVLFTVACALLADWQWHRRTEVRAAIHQVASAYSRRPVPLRSLLPANSSALVPADQWRPVRVSGHYQPSETIVVRDRDDGQGDSGFLVLVPLRLDAGGTFIVDRGWVAPAGDVNRPARIPAPPRGHVSVVARLRPSESPDHRTAPAGQVHVIDVEGSVRLGVAASGGTGARRDAANLLTAVYGIRVRETPSPRATPRLEAAPSTDEGPHLAYAVQWCLFAIGAWIFLVVHMRRRAYEDDIAAGRRSRRAEVVVLDPRRRRSDEEIEDSQLDAAERAHAAALETRWVEYLRAARAELAGRGELEADDDASSISIVDHHGTSPPAG